MNYLKLKESIEKAIHAHPMEVEPYNDFFDLCREYEKIDFAVAHEWNHMMYRPNSAQEPQLLTSVSSLNGDKELQPRRLPTYWMITGE